MHTILSFNSFQQVAIFILFMPPCPQYAHWIILKQVLGSSLLKSVSGYISKIRAFFYLQHNQNIIVTSKKKKFLKIITCSGQSVFKFPILFESKSKEGPYIAICNSFASGFTLYVPTHSLFFFSLFFFPCQLFAEETGYLSKS